MTKNINKNLKIDVFKNYTPKNEFLLVVDSDGTVFDTMEFKHKNFYIKSLIEEFNLKSIELEVIKIWKKINLYSNYRGANRFIALLKFFEKLSKTSLSKKNNLISPNLNLLKNWIKTTNELSDKSFSNFLIDNKNNDAENIKVIKWSKKINYLIDSSNHAVNAFDGAIKAFKGLYSKVDIVVVSNTPIKTLYNNWLDSKLISYLSAIGGQETGTKKDMLKVILSRKYDLNKILVIGDSSNDYLIARESNVLFFPIIPNFEELSWDIFINEASQKFFRGAFNSSYQEKLLVKFESNINKSFL